MTILLVLTLSAFGDWTYDGFASDTAKPAATASVVRVQDTPLVQRPPKPTPRETTDSVDSASRKSLTPSAALVTAPPAGPSTLQRWRLADASGQVWEFHDPERLKEWVKARNASPSVNTTVLPTGPLSFGWTSNCPTGRCYAGR